MPHKHHRPKYKALAALNRYRAAAACAADAGCPLKCPVEPLTSATCSCQRGPVSASNPGLCCGLSVVRPTAGAPSPEPQARVRGVPSSHAPWALTVCHLCTTGSRQRGRRRLRTAGCPSAPLAPQCSSHPRCTEGLRGKQESGFGAWQPWGSHPLPLLFKLPFTSLHCRKESKPPLSPCQAPAALALLSRVGLGKWGTPCCSLAWPSSKTGAPRLSGTVCDPVPTP